jgi:hypothetical protein
MKYIYYLTTFLVIITMVVVITLFTLGKVNGILLPISIVFINGITLVVILVDKILFINKRNESLIPEVVTSPVIEQADIDLKESVDDNPNNEIAKKWSNSMYNRFAERWQNLYDHIGYPTEKASKAEISVMSWEIASLTMDYLMLANDSPNLLERHKASVNSIINNKNYQEMGLKAFYEDPTTVPAKVLPVYNTLSPQMAARQSFETNIFGYYVVIPNKNE